MAEPSVAVNTPPTMPPITMTGINRISSERQASCATRRSENDSPVRGSFLMWA
jgi:hypothetical protein